MKTHQDYKPRAVITDHTNYGVTRMSSIVQKSSVHVFVPRGLAESTFVALHVTATEFYSRKKKMASKILMYCRSRREVVSSCL